MGEEERENTQAVTPGRLATITPEELLSDVITPLENSISRRRNRCFLVLYYPEIEDVSMTSRDVSLVRYLMTCNECPNRIDIFIHSSGGDIHTAYKLAKLFQKRCKDTNALIPEYAKSAATLLALGCNQLEMSAIAELGPLDPMVIFERRGGGYPAFAIRDAPKVLEREIEECRDPDVRRLKAEFVIGPIAAKIDPYILTDVSNMPALALDYGKKLLTKVGYPPRTAERILKRLVLEKGRPSHGYVIDVDESIELDINASEMDDRTEFEMLQLLGYYRAFEQKRSEEGNPLTTPIVRLTYPTPEESTN